MHDGLGIDASPEINIKAIWLFCAQRVALASTGGGGRQVNASASVQCVDKSRAAF